MIRAPFYTARDWYIVQPILYRFLKQRDWVDSFFETGELWLSSFQAFRKHQDEQRGDLQEGAVLVQSAYIQPDGTPAYVFARGRVPDNAYILCGTMSNDPAIASDFRAEGGIAIHETTRFAKAVGRHIPGHRYGTEGPCIYASVRAIDRDLGSFPWVTAPSDLPAPADKAVAAAWLENRINVHPFYVKHPRFKHQLEYRLVWVTDREVNGQLPIKVPEALVHCQRVSANGTLEYHAPA